MKCSFGPGLLHWWLAVQVGKAAGTPLTLINLENEPWRSDISSEREITRLSSQTQAARSSRSKLDEPRQLPRAVEVDRGPKRHVLTGHFLADFLQVSSLDVCPEHKAGERCLPRCHLDVAKK